MTIHDLIEQSYYVRLERKEIEFIFDTPSYGGVFRISYVSDSNQWVSYVKFYHNPVAANLKVL